MHLSSYNKSLYLLQGISNSNINIDHVTNKEIKSRIAACVRYF